MNNLFDTHCHLDLFQDIHAGKFIQDDLGIKTITVTNTPSFYIHNCQLFEKNPNVRVALGFHPQLAGQFQDEMNLLEQLVKDARYIGEVGLDGSKDLSETYQLQKKIFQKVLEQCKAFDNKIITVHSRNAAVETIDMLHEYLSNSNCKVILHWFSGNLTNLRTAVAKGFYFSINHKMANSLKGRELIRYIPDSKLLTETDAPFTFSDSIKTRYASLESTVKALAIERHKSIDTINAILFSNFKSLVS